MCHILDRLVRSAVLINTLCRKEVWGTGGSSRISDIVILLTEINMILADSCKESGFQVCCFKLADGVDKNALSPLTKLEMQHNKKRNRIMLIIFGKG